VTEATLHDVFHSTAFTVTRNLVLFFAVLFWLAIAYWTHRDAKRRIDDPWLVATGTVLGLVPIVGPLVYFLFRPPETLADVRARAIEVQALEARLLRPEPKCPVCRSTVEASFLICPVCTTQLKKPCVACKAPLEPLWQACPYCATPIGATAVDLDATLATEAAAQANGAARTGARPAPS
jgi:hypothetical protein